MAGDQAFPQWVRARRGALRLAQRDLAQQAGLTPGNLSAIESGKRPVGDAVRKRLERALTEFPSVVLDLNRDRVLAAARKHGIEEVRVFGSVARGTDRVDSDIDLLVTPPRDNPVVNLIDFHDEVEALLATRVDVMTDHDGPTGRALGEARREALAL